LALKYSEIASDFIASGALEGIMTHPLLFPHGPGFGSPTHLMYTSPPDPTATAVIDDALYLAAILHPFLSLSLNSSSSIA
jgi:hypothetical protein